MTKFFVVERVLVNVDDGKETPDGWTMWMEKDDYQCLILRRKANYEDCIDYAKRKFFGDMGFMIEWLNGSAMELRYRGKP